MKQILLIATGGTIASKSTARGLAPQISAEEIIGYIPSAKEFCQIDTAAPFNLDSTNVNSRHWLELARLIEKKYEYYDGFVICHGTDTMAYTAAALSYLIQNNRKPVVITGAQRPIDLPITDARSNLLTVSGLLPMTGPTGCRLSSAVKLVPEPGPEKSVQKAIMPFQASIIRTLQASMTSGLFFILMIRSRLCAL